MKELPCPELLIRKSNTSAFFLNSFVTEARLVKQQQWLLSHGSTSLSVDVMWLVGSMYYLELKGETINKNKQFIKQ